MNDYFITIPIYKIITMALSNKNKIYIYTGKYGRQCYRIKNKKTYYDINFPLTLALELQNSVDGPERCLNCLEYASFNGVQLYLCGNCNQHSINKYYDCSCIRGGSLQEIIDKELDCYFTDGFMNFGCSSMCILNNYYKDICFDQICLSDKHNKKRKQNIRNIYKRYISNYDKLQELIQLNKKKEHFQLKGHTPCNKHIYFDEDGSILCTSNDL